MSFRSRLARREDTLPSGKLRSSNVDVVHSMEVRKLLSRPEENLPSGEPRDVAHGADLLHSVEVRELYKSFGQFPALAGLNLRLTDGAITTILGPSGAGKSVLIKHLVGLLKPDKGEIFILGRNLWKISPKERYELSTQRGVLFQEGALFGSRNLYDNIAFPLRMHTHKSEDEIRDIVMRRLTEVGLEKACLKRPHQISGGMRKRAAFARALAMDPGIVFFDQPDSGLDPVRRSLLGELILDMHAEYRGTYMLVTHNVRTAREISDYIGLMWKGQIVYFNSAENAFASDNPFVRQFLSGDAAGPMIMS